MSDPRPTGGAACRRGGPAGRRRAGSGGDRSPPRWCARHAARRRCRPRHADGHVARRGIRSARWAVRRGRARSGARAAVAGERSRAAAGDWAVARRKHADTLDAVADPQKERALRAELDELEGATRLAERLPDVRRRAASCAPTAAAATTDPRSTHPRRWCATPTGSGQHGRRTPAHHLRCAGSSSPSDSAPSAARATHPVSPRTPPPLPCRRGARRAQRTSSPGSCSATSIRRHRRASRRCGRSPRRPPARDA